MPNPYFSKQQQYSSNSLWRSAKPAIPDRELYQAGYQQALIDFAITDLLQDINTYSDTHFDAAWAALTTQEVETLAAILIQTLIASLKGNLLETYLSAIRDSPFDTFTPLLTKLHLPHPATDLPTTFPDVEKPRFLYGESASHRLRQRVRWTTNNETTDWGTVIGRFYGFASHCCRWRWCAGRCSAMS